MKKKSITDISYETISQLILESEWGKAVTNQELFEFLFDECYELLDGCNKDNYENLLEESSDVLMILLYIVIKNQDSRSETNIIEELLKRLNMKLRTRYSLFFEGNSNSEAEEKHWIETKHLEKEVCQYLYCPSNMCLDYAQFGRGNMVIYGDQVKCKTCGYSAKISSHNMLLYSSKSRRNLFEILDNYYNNFLKGTVFFAETYFRKYQKEYIKVLRYYTSYNTWKLALTNFFTSKHNGATEKSFQEFLIYPLRSYIQDILQKKFELSSYFMEINDLIIKYINLNYLEIKSVFCNERKDYAIWINYIQTLFKTMTVPTEYKQDYYTSNAVLKKYMNEFDILDMFQNYLFRVVVERHKVIKIVLEDKSDEVKTDELYLPIDISNCYLISQIGQVLITIVMKFSLHNLSLVNIMFLNRKSKINKNQLLEFTRDLIPVIGDIKC